MKKIIYIMSIILIFYFYTNYNKEISLPSNAIRFRIIANSNSSIDQTTKLLIKKDLEQNLFPLLENSKSPEETKKIIEENKNVINNTLKKYNIPYNINYGLNYFPQKKFKGVTYSEGKYESLVISLGTGKGENWWCVMYPPLCLIDSKSEDYSDVEYKSFIYEKIAQLTS